MVPTLAGDGAAEAVVALCGMEFLARRRKVKSDEVRRTTATDSGYDDALNEALIDAELFALVTPNV